MMYCAIYQIQASIYMLLTWHLYWIARQKNDQSLANNVEAEESSKDDYVPVPMEVEVEYGQLDIIAA